MLNDLQSFTNKLACMQHRLRKTLYIRTARIAHKTRQDYAGKKKEGGEGVGEAKQ